MKKRKIEVKNYNKEWEAKYKVEKEKLENIFSDILVDIYHIGSTSIPNIKAKPVIDIMISVTDIKKVDKYNNKMRELDYSPMGEYGIKNRRFFLKGEIDRTHHVHIFQKGDKEIKKHLNFRDYLRINPQLANQYSKLKEELAAKYPHDIEKYVEGKNGFIKEIDKKAKKYFNDRKMI